MVCTFSSNTKYVSLNVPYALQIVSSNGVALGDNATTTLTAYVLDVKTETYVTFPETCFKWIRKEDPTSYSPKNNSSVLITKSDLVNGNATFSCIFSADNFNFTLENSITISETIKGENGWSSFNLTLYKRSETEPATFDGGDLTYTFATNSLEGNLGTWSRDIPTDSTDPVWAIYAMAFAQTATDTIPSARWTSPARLSTEGTAGAKGDSVVTIFIFQKSETKPATPTTNVSYNLTSGEISNISPWSKNVPTGSERVWVSLATGVTNSDSIVILPARWSSPEIFREKGDTGKGIQSVTTYYLISNQNTGITRDTEGWSTTPQTTTSTLKYLWQYTETLWTDGSKTYTEPIITGTHGEQGAQGKPGKDGADGEDGKDGADAPEVQIQYAWGMSNTVEPSPSIWLFDGKFFVWNGQFVGSTELWSYTRTKKPQDGNLWYEWIRWSTDGGKTWKKPQCLTSDYIIDFTIEVSPATYAMTSRQYVKTLQVLTLHCRKTNYVGSSQAIWTIPAKETTTDGETIENYISFSNADGSELYDGNTHTGDTVYVSVQEGCMMTSFPVKCSLEGLGEKETAVAGSFSEFKPEYLGIVNAKDGQSLSNFVSTSNGPVREGDVVVYIYENANGDTISEYKKCIGVGTNENNVTQSQWADNTISDSNNSQLMINGLYDAITSGSKNADMLRMVKQLVAQYIAAEYINITKAIFGGERYSLENPGTENEQVKDNGNGVGFFLDAITGVLKAYGAQMTDLQITTYSEDKLQPILITQKKTISKNGSASSVDKEYIIGKQITNAYRAYYEAEEDDIGHVLFLSSMSRAYAMCDKNTWAYILNYQGVWQGNSSTTVGRINFEYELNVHIDKPNIFGGSSSLTLIVNHLDGTQETWVNYNSTNGYSNTFVGRTGDKLSLSFGRTNFAGSGHVRVSIRAYNINCDEYVIGGPSIRGTSGIANLTILGGGNGSIQLFTRSDYYYPHDSYQYGGIMQEQDVWDYFDNTAYYINQVELREFFKDLPNGNVLCSADSWIRFNRSDAEKYYIQNIIKYSDSIAIYYFGDGPIGQYKLSTKSSSSEGFDDIAVEISIRIIDVPNSLVTATLIPSETRVGNEEIIESDIGLTDKPYRNGYFQLIRPENIDCSRLPDSSQISSLSVGSIYKDGNTLKIKT